MEDEMKQISIDAIAFDLEAIMDFIFQTNTKNKSSEIREVWDKNAEGSLEMIQKSLAEVKSDELGAVANIRYDLVKILIEEVSSIGMINDSSEEKIEELGIDEDEIYVGAPVVTNLGQMLALNTLQKEGMLINLERKDSQND